MTKQFLILFLLSSFCFFGQEKDVKLFVNPPRTTPRFIEDQDLSEIENKEIFRQKITEKYIRYLDNTDISQYFYSTHNKIYFSFNIDSLGYSKFKKIWPRELINSQLAYDLSKIVDSLPRFIPATENNRPVTISYTIPISKNK